MATIAIKGSSFCTRVGCPFTVARTCTNVLACNLIPKTIRLASSINFLTKEVYQERQGKFFHPDRITAGHCCSMAVQFLSYCQTDSKSIREAAGKMSEGANAKCAEITESYIHAGGYSAVFSAYNLEPAKTIYTDYTFEELHAFLTKELPEGRYLFMVPGHLLALVKDREGDLYFWDSNFGIAKVDQDGANCGWLKSILNIYQCFTTPSLELISLVNKGEAGEYSEYDTHCSKPPVILENEADGNWQKIDVHWRGKDYLFVQNLTTGEIYNGDSKGTIRLKCTLLLITTPVMIAIRMLFNLAMFALFFAITPIMIFEGRDRFIEHIIQVKDYGVNAVRAPFYGLMGEIAALVGLVLPYLGRRCYGWTERTFNQDLASIDLAKFYLASSMLPINFDAKDKYSEADNLDCIKRAIRHYQWLDSGLTLPKAKKEGHKPVCWGHFLTFLFRRCLCACPEACLDALLTPPSLH